MGHKLERCVYEYKRDYYFHLLGGKSTISRVSRVSKKEVCKFSVSRNWKSTKFVTCQFLTEIPFIQNQDESG